MNNHLAFTIHADDPWEIMARIACPETGLRPRDMLKLDALVFIDGVETPRGFVRSVTGLYEKDAGGRSHTLAFRRREDGNGFERFVEPTPLEEEISGFFRTLVERKVRGLDEVRRYFLRAASSPASSQREEGSHGVGLGQGGHKKPSRRRGEGFL